MIANFVIFSLFLLGWEPESTSTEVGTSTNNKEPDVTPATQEEVLPEDESDEPTLRAVSTPIQEPALQDVSSAIDEAASELRKKTDGRKNVEQIADFDKRLKEIEKLQWRRNWMDNQEEEARSASSPKNNPPSHSSKTRRLLSRRKFCLIRVPGKESTITAR